jgi:GTP-binding protein HflX
LFDRPSSGERAVLVHSRSHHDEDDLAELRELAISAGAEPVAVVTAGRRQTPDPRYFLGLGKLEELEHTIQELGAEVVLFDHALTPSQERNLEKALSVRVVDRTGLILDIFAQRAQTFEGKLQVELAQLKHLATRLVRGWTHLERQKGGIGLRGPGETQLETDKRLLAQRIRIIQKRLEKVEQQRDQGRNARKRAEIPVVGLVGYTNAGKSTLFNALTRADVYAADQLFATLDPTLRRYQVANGLAVILADTVGFIRHLPHELVAAFRATLGEVRNADLLLHVIDASDDRVDDTIAQVEAVLAEIGADQVPTIRVYNKIDLLEHGTPRRERRESGEASRVWLSARSGMGFDLLDQAIAERLGGATVRTRLHIEPTQGSMRARLYAVARILSDEVDEAGGWRMEVEIPKRDAGLLRQLSASEPTQVTTQVS